ncbi:IclR family transcriptional regulator [Chelatococcus reniformis]|uniref:IclR family transcriptional regulator n=1 Tax=Chelatococcus reniformis TaxID=1494448 RepID=A0A916TWZ1_9HYPH|nr:IclR family transcriptional regulator [Chelatococcus reniformis]GGC48952.1 IclR family transcriptional regulator [Chelatococcus reniformis]
MPAPQAKAKSAPALVRGLRVLEMIAAAPTPLNLTAIAAGLGVAMSSAHSICVTLINEGYIARAGDGRFGLTLRVLDLARAKIASYEPADHFHAACDEIQLIRENGATMSVLDGPDVYFIAARNSPQPLGVTFRPGARMPACCTASGRALLAALTDEEVCRLYPQEALPQLTKDHPKHRRELLALLAKARRAGYSTEIKGTRPHMYSYGALVAPPSGRAQAGVAITMYEGDITPAVERQAIEAIRTLAERLARFGDLVG